MRIKFDKLRIQNFYSYGDMQLVDFTNFTSTVILIDGIDKDTEGSKIGSGKSSLMAALTYAVFGETVSNVKANEIVNYIKGKNALVELEFFVEKQKYKIERGRKPKILNIYKLEKDDTEESGYRWDNISKADDRDNDRELKRLFRMNFETFLQTSFFSVASEHNKPFLNMTPTNQKKVLENIFNFDIHNMLISEVKDTLRDEQVKLADLESSAKEIKISNEQLTEQLERLANSYEKFENRRTKEIDSLNEKISFYNKIDIDEEKEKYDFVGELKEHKSSINEDIVELRSSQKDVNASIASETRELEIVTEKYEKEQKKNNSLKGSICPTCKQVWEDQNAINVSDDRLIEYERSIIAYEKSIDKFEQSATQIKTSLDEKRELVFEIKEAMEQIELSVDKKELDNIDIVVSNIKKELEQTVNQENHYLAEIEANNALIREYDIETIDKVTLSINDYKDCLKRSEDPKNRGKFLRRYIKQSNEILRGFKKLIPDYNIHIQFNPDFTIRVMKLGKEVNPGSLSNGEKRIGNIMIMMALMKVFKLKNNVEFNAMFMDEVLDSGINGTLLESVYAFIKNVAKQEKMRVYLISHREEIKEKVKEVIMVTKSRGISTIEMNPEIIE
jgi:DNA repair exonuclease SbcCD ATPase subunit